MRSLSATGRNLKDRTIAKADLHFGPGLFFGRTAESSHDILGTKHGVYTVRKVKRLPSDNQEDSDMVTNMVAVPLDRQSEGQRGRLVAPEEPRETFRPERASGGEEVMLSRMTRTITTFLLSCLAQSQSRAFLCQATCPWRSNARCLPTGSHHVKWVSEKQCVQD